MGVLRSFSDEVAALAQRVGPAVVHVRALRESSLMLGTGSGLIVTPDGLVLTNAHFLREATAVEVVLADGRTLVADVLGEDGATDTAVLRVPAETPLPHAPLGCSERLRVGDLAIVLGSPEGGSFTVSTGTVSSLSRTLRSELGGGLLESVIETDALLDPRSSGGPLLDAEGEVVGINSALFFPAHGTWFSLPAISARFVLDEIVRHGRVRRAYLGIGVEAVHLPARTALEHGLKAERAVAVRALDSTSPAAKAGLREGDVIISLAGRPVECVTDIHRRLDRAAIGAALEVEVLRRGQRTAFVVRPVEIPLAA